MANLRKSVANRKHSLLREQFFADHPVLRLDQWAEVLEGPDAGRRARERARYGCATGKLVRVTRSLYAVVPPGVPAERFVPDPYLVAAALRPDAILSHHSALDLLGVAHSVFSRFAYLTGTTRRPLRFRGHQWHALSHPDVLVKAGRTDFGVVSADRRGVALRLTGAERTLVDGLLGLRWVGGLEEHLASAAAFRDLDLDLVLKYLRLLDRRILYAAVGWFLEKHPETSDVPGRFLRNLEGKLPATPLYLGPRTPGGRLQARWRLIVPAHLGLQAGFEGSAP